MTTRPYRTRQWLASTARSQRAGLLPFSADSIVAGEPRAGGQERDRELEQTHGSHNAHSFFFRGETRCRHWSLVVVLILLATPVDLVSLWRLHIGYWSTGSSRQQIPSGIFPLARAEILITGNTA